MTTAFGVRAVVSGIGAALPRRVVTNAELAAYLDTTDAWIRSRTGIASRRWVTAGTATADLAAAAGRRALACAGTDAVDAVVLATATPDHPVPATAPEVATRLGLSGVAAFDIAAVCSGFVYGLATAAGMLAGGDFRRVLLIGADTYSTIVDPKDRTTAVIFGDGAGAVVLRAGDAAESGALGPCDLGSDGRLADLGMIPAGGSRQRSANVTAVAEDHYFQMRGNDMYRNAVQRMSESAGRALERAGWTVADVDRFVPHQANARIATAVAERLGLTAGQPLSNIEHVGNTAAASIPLLLAQAHADGRLRPGDRALVAAFGSGATWGATTLVWPDLPADGEPDFDLTDGE
ncbi:3-oxoacyl-[acyl-carrier-protein] synthase III [Micromonospora matsumotoense]|uniref:Beta-ketoacyl-[acyl-carrier-protein] synthase III n=1 Tax=Micromonospora matsumotoense TaxID=121616 RepID=A0A1C5AXD3_9ACTN|nr:beta-ketoacyl-ACP synthase III [Micromonospora matsumotoense]SCF49711.1 3-oxoacyl-[acyl-carrier-protein] synthase III [Micromonospora matsumotoense]